MNYLDQNENLLKSIDENRQKIDVLLDNYSDNYKIRSWGMHFNCIMDEITEQIFGNVFSKRSKFSTIKSFLSGEKKPLDKSFPNRSPIFSQNNISLTFFPEYTTVTTTYGFKICLTGFDFWHPIASGQYSVELSETVLMLRILPYISTFIDIGANVGFFSLLIAHQSQKKVKVIAFEPIEENRSLFNSAIIQNNFQDKIQVCPYAVGDKKEDSIIATCTAGSGGHCINPLPKNAEMFDGGKSVNVITLDSIFEKNPKIFENCLIKIDVEGFEINVLRGSENILKSPHLPIILFESWPESSISKKTHIIVINYLVQQNYTVYEITSVSHGSPLVKRIDVSNHISPSETGNYLAIPPWAEKFIHEIQKPLDMRILSDTGSLQHLNNFIDSSLLNLEIFIHQSNIQ